MSGFLSSDEVLDVGEKMSRSFDRFQARDPRDTGALEVGGRRLWLYREDGAANQVGAVGDTVGDVGA